MNVATRTKIIKGSPKSSKRGSPKSSKSKNWFADHPSPILKRPAPIFERSLPSPRYLAALAAKLRVLGPLGLVTLVTLPR